MSLFSEVTEQIDQTSLNFGSAYWIQQQVLDAINWALLDTWANIKWQFVSTQTVVSSGADITSLPVTTVMIPQYIINTASVKIFPTTHDLLQDWSSNWRNEPQAEPHWIVLWDQAHGRVWPPANGTYTWTLYGVPWPTEVTTTDGTTDPAPLDPSIRHAIIHRAVAFLLEHSQPQLADVNEAEAMDHEKRYFRQVRNAQGANTLRLRPAPGWVVGQFGDIKIARKYN